MTGVENVLRSVGFGLVRGWRVVGYDDKPDDRKPNERGERCVCRIGRKNQKSKSKLMRSVDKTKTGVC